MTEAEWVAADGPVPMLAWLLHGSQAGPHGVEHGRSRCASDRKLWLFVAGVERLWWGDRAGARGRKSCDLLEAVADGRASPDALRRVAFSYTMPRRAPECAAECVRVHNSPGDPAQWACLLREIFGNPFRPVPGEPCRECSGGVVPTDRDDNTCPCCGGTGRRFPRRWLTPTALRLARGIYADYDFAALPVLADALEEAGCEEDTLLRHLRGQDRCGRCLGGGAECPGRGPPCVSLGLPSWDRCGVCGGSGWVAAGPHARGCFVLDLILGKS